MTQPKLSVIVNIPRSKAPNRFWAVEDAVEVVRNTFGQNVIIVKTKELTNVNQT